MHSIADGALSEGMASYGAQYSLKFTVEFYKHLQMPIYRSSYSDWVNDFASAASNMRRSPSETHSMSPEELRDYIISEQTSNAKKITAGLKAEITTFADSVSNVYKSDF